MKTILIAAIARNGVIGRTSKACTVCLDSAHSSVPFGRTPPVCQTNGGRVPCNDIPWLYPEIDQHYRDRGVEVGGVLLDDFGWSFARKHRLFRSCGKSVVSQSLLDLCAKESRESGDGPALAATENVALSTTLDAALAALREAYIPEALIYAPSLYAAGLPLADELDLTLIDREYEGDVKFPINFVRTPVMSLRDDGRPNEIGTYIAPKPEGSESWSRDRILEHLDKTTVVFELAERRKGEHADLTFTRWVRR